MDIQSFRQDLQSWYYENKRDLPFRRQKDPYQIWISEIMAQQTRMEALIPYFKRFMKAYPTLADLAQSEEEALMKVWQGLGYYSRARSLQKAAKICMEEYEGSLPASYEKLVKLPGIGPYSAGAIASIAFNLPYTAVDGNVIRVFSRLFYIQEETDDPKVRKRIAALVEEALDRENPGDFNQALMELGALICIPKSPRCSVCPVQSHCLGKDQPDVKDLPLKKPKKEKTEEQKPVYIWLARKEGQWYTRINQRPKKGLLAGLYEFESKPPKVIYQIRDLEDSRFVFTHKIWNMKGQICITDWQPDFVPWDQLELSYAIPGAFESFYRQTTNLLEEIEETCSINQ